MGEWKGLRRAQLQRASVIGPPLSVVLPGHGTRPALIPAHLESAPEVLGDAAAPSGLADGAVYGLYLVPTLFLCDVGEEGRREGVLQDAARLHRR